MLLRFGVENFRSMSDKQELSLVASSLQDVSSGLIAPPALTSSRLLPAVVIYGANASGKSTLVSAIQWMRTAVLLSHSAGDPGGSVPVQPFLLKPRNGKKFSTFDIDFIVDNVRYHYGFQASKDAFIAEWLYSFPNERRQTLYQRDQQEFVFGRSLKGQNRVISGLTRPNSLFLSAATQNGHEHLSKVSAFFRNLQVDKSSTENINIQRLASDGLDRRIIEFLSKIGTGVVGYRKEEKMLSEKAREFRQELDLILKKHFGGADTNREDDLFDIQLAHKADSSVVYLDLTYESAGTRRLLILLHRVFRALDEGTVMISDELDASLHTQACEALLALFSVPDTNPKGAQLIATTHDTNLLRSALLRRDQVWFTEKNTEGATFLYPLTDIHSRKGDNIEKGYLQGRYGAIPFSGSVTGLIPAA